MNTFKVGFFSSKNNIVFDKVISISVNTLGGRLTILANHAPYVFCILSCIAVIKIDKKQEKKFILGNGTLEVAHNSCTIITDSFAIQN